MIDTTVAIWDYLYLVRYPVHMAKPIEEIRKFGVPVTGDKKADKHVMSEQGHRWMNINDMVEYFREGVPIHLKPEDTRAVYEAISSHIHAWRIQLDQGFNTGSAPIEDLILMDDFANSVYEHAVHQVPRNQADSVFSAHLRRSAVFTLNTPVKKPITPSGEPIKTPKRNSLADFFKEKFADRAMSRDYDDA